ncbi:MAG: SurA N-terminal domain-containing protein, partial [Lentisphaerae bacterium]|nr:SurA N-terminal domain-containing protein [Lentisphaerota bacterium]
MISFRPYTVLLTALTLPILVIGCGKKTDVAQIDVQSSDIAPIVDIGSDANSYADPAATVVEVNGKKMTEGECNAQIDRVMISQGMHQLPDEQRSQARTALRQNVIDSFIAITVLTREADARKVTVSDEDINGAIESIKAKIPPGANFQDLLSHQGFSESDLREQIATDMKITKLIEMQCVGIPDPSNEEIRS